MGHEKKLLQKMRRNPRKTVAHSKFVTEEMERYLGLR